MAGLSEELLNVLARISGLKVTSRTSSFVVRDSELASRKIAGQLGLAYLLDGSVRREGEEVRITAQLIHADSDQQVWSQSYQRRLDEIFRVQEEIWQSIAGKRTTNMVVDSSALLAILFGEPAASELAGRLLAATRRS